MELTGGASPVSVQEGTDAASTRAHAAAERAGRVREAFTQLLGAGGLDAERAPRWRLGLGEPAPVLLPATEAEVAACLRRASEEGWTVVPAGAGSWFGAGHPVRSVDAILSVSRLDRIVQYEPANLTLTAGAGLSMGGLDRLVSHEGQWLPLDPPGTLEGTLGGTLATGSAGGLQVAYGGPRDLVLGLRMVTGDGRVLELGGRVVKNVAGFDLVKLAVGSWGTLGVITEASLRLFPRPERELLLVGRAERLEALVAPARRAARAKVVPASVELLERPAGTDPGSPREALLIVRLVGLAARVEREAALFEKVTAPQPLERVDARSEAGAALLDALRMVDDGCELSLRMTAPQGELGEVVTVARAAGRVRPGRDEVASTAHRVRVDAQRGSLLLALPSVRGDPPLSDEWAERLGEVRATLELRGGSLTIARGPATVVGPAGAWGKIGGASRLMAGLRAQFDPAGILAPGRFAFDEG